MTEKTQTATTWTVGQVAQRFGVTVRTLRHYDEIGLLVPTHRTPAGYRCYTDDDLTRLQQIVVYRRLELPLEQIAEVLAGGDSAVEHLRRQRAAVMFRLDTLRDLVAAIDRALEKEMSNQQMSTDDLRNLFGDVFDDSYAEEARQRWGDSEVWAQSQQRTARFTRADWTDVKAESDAVNAAFASLSDAGVPPTAEAAMDAAEAHRASIERFYDCSYPMHRGLGDMYLADPRFTAMYEAVRPGLARYVRDAIHANADRRQ